MLAWLVAVSTLGAAAAPAPTRGYTIEPPPGWVQIDDPSAPPIVLLRLNGPEGSSFVLSEAARLPLSNRAAVRSYLAQVLASLKTRTGAAFGSPGPLLTTRFDNGLTLQYVKVDLKGKPRLVLGAGEFGGRVVLATLVSAVPDTLLPAILGALRSSAPVAEANPLVSADGQLQWAPKSELYPRELTPEELKEGFVLALEGRGSELMILKVLEEDAGPSKDQPQIVRQTVLAFPGVDAKTVGRVERIQTPPGPDFIFASAAVHDPSGPERFLAGYMPWGYWGYSVLGKGSEPEALARDFVSALVLGPSAEARVVAASRPIPLPRAWGLAWPGALGAVTVLVAWLSLRRR